MTPTCFLVKGRCRNGVDKELVRFRARDAVKVAAKDPIGALYDGVALMMVRSS